MATESVTLIEQPPCGYRFFIREKGRSHHPTLVFFHGFLGSHLDWEDVIKRLPERYRTLAVDLPGHGKTEVTPAGHARCFTMPRVAAALAQWIGTASESPVVLIGYSLGGRLALYLAVHYPDLFRAIVLESASPGLRTASERHQRRQWDEHWARQLEREPFPRFLEKWYNQPLFRTLKHHPSFDALFRQRLNNRPEWLAHVLRGMGTGVQPSLWEHLPTLKKPLLLLTGEKDPKFRAISEEMVRMAPKCSVKVIAGCGHNIHRENPDAFVQAILDFLHHPLE
ncbi:MAG: 2-succinyl-6-hydroxy-2,4-cyclohexadiene-1-carboxylate synthase [Calditrichaeota bacterium]|nr:2-succinyl-6-hydroxy-2,4-cyclohexadiene-1-carboxylate synthase [Calditrichota bacterium]